MGAAIINSLAESFPKQNLFAIDKDLTKLKQLKIDQISTEFQDFLPKSDVIILAIKPQVFGNFAKVFLQILSTSELNSKLLISIMAGVNLDKLEKLSGLKKVIRSMPNLAVTMQKSVIGWLANSAVEKNEKEFVKQVFETMGLAIEVKKEQDLDSITALSGSGPAYFFYLTEILAEQAEKFGFDSSTSQKLAIQTLTGTAKLLKNNTLSAKEFKQKVTSKGGTTEAALNYLMDKNFAKTFQNAILAAQKKSEELANLTN